MKLAVHLSYSGSTYALDRPKVLAGRKAEAEAAVPDALVDDVALGGPRERIRDRLAVWKEAGLTALMVGGDVAAVRTMAELLL